MNLSDAPVVVSLTASDVNRAKGFYAEKLGLKEVPTEEGAAMFEAGGGTRIFVYNSGAPKATNTAASFKVDDVLATVNELKGKGITFESYDMGPIKTDENNIAKMGDLEAAWFKDTEGNILCVNNQ
jgi:predicted enzyme related to lactoylglutathione lyase